MTATTSQSAILAARRPRAFVRVAGPDAEDYLQRMLSNDMAALAPGEACDALLLTAKARVIAPLRVVRRSAEDFLLLTEPELGERVLAELLRFRFAAKAEIADEEHEAYVLLGADSLPEAVFGFPTTDYGVAGFELLDSPPPAGVRLLGDEELEALRIEAGTPRFGREVDERVLPAEAGLVERAVSFSKGCYPGQEPIARQHYRGKVNRSLRVLDIESAELPGYDAELRLDGKAVGRVTSAARSASGTLVGLGYVRVEVAAGAELELDGGRARLRARSG